MFIALDHLIQHVRDHDFVDIYGLVAELRSERMCMVQNLVSARQISLFQSPEKNKQKRKERGDHTVFCLKLFQWQCSCPTFHFVPCCDPIPVRKYLENSRFDKGNDLAVD